MDLDCLRISGPRASPEEVRSSKKAVEQGRDLLRWEGSPSPTHQAVIWRLLIDAVETLQNLKDPETRWRNGSHILWPTVMHSSQEMFEAETFRLTVLKEERGQPPPPRLGNSDSEAEPRMMTVLSWLKHIHSRSPHLVKRDKMIVLSLASGKGPLRTRMAYFPHDTSDSAVRWVKFKALRQIEEALTGMHVFN